MYCEDFEGLHEDRNCGLESENVKDNENTYTRLRNK